MATEEIGILAGAGVDLAETFSDLGLVKGLEDCLDAVWLLGMPEPGVMFFVGEIGYEDGFHGASVESTGLVFRDNVAEGLKEGDCVVWAGSGLGVVLDREDGKFLVAETGHGVVV